MLLHIMLYIMLAYLMLFAALSNAVCLYDASFFPFISANDFCFQSINQDLFSFQTNNNNNNIHTFVYMNTERAGNEVTLLIYVSSQIKWQEQFSKQIT